MVHLQVLRSFPFAWREKWELHKAADEDTVSKGWKVGGGPAQEECGESKSPLDKRALTINGKCRFLLD